MEETKCTLGASQTSTTVPLVLVHGLWDTPRLFRHLQAQLGDRRQPQLVPHLAHGLGWTPLEQLAAQLGKEIDAAFGPEQPLDLLGFSMGGVIARTWIQLLGGWRRTRRFISVASPHQGTLTALPWPRRWLAGIADMKPDSPLLRQLDSDLEPLRRIECTSFYCPADLTVVPGWKAVLPVGPRHPLQGLRHDRLLIEPAGLEPLVRELLRT
jgi:triacylglycerol lipase